MRLSDDKVSHLTHVAVKALLERDAVALIADEGQIRRDIRRVIIRELKIAEGIDEAVKRKLQSYSKKIYEGGSEWEVLYQKFFNEEAAKKGRA